MTDRLFADCCYGSEHQHLPNEPCPQQTASMTDANELRARGVCDRCDAEDLLYSGLCDVCWNAPDAIASREAAVKPLGDDAGSWIERTYAASLDQPILERLTGALSSPMIYERDGWGARTFNLVATAKAEVETLTRELDKAREALANIASVTPAWCDEQGWYAAVERMTGEASAALFATTDLGREGK